MIKLWFGKFNLHTKTGYYCDVPDDKYLDDLSVYHLGKLNIQFKYAIYPILYKRKLICYFKSGLTKSKIHGLIPLILSLRLIWVNK